jgi:hypothetical protein
MSCDAALAIYRRRCAPWHWKLHRRQTAEILRCLAGVLYGVSHLLRCSRLCPASHYSHDSNRPTPVGGCNPRSPRYTARAWPPNLTSQSSARAPSADGPLSIFFAPEPSHLLDAWGPGNSRSSSGGETRVIRGAYGPDQPYTKLAARALDLWKQHEAQWKQKFFFPIGVLWMVEGDDAFGRGSLPSLKDAGIPFEQLAVNELARRWPQISFETSRGLSRATQRIPAGTRLNSSGSRSVRSRRRRVSPGSGCIADLDSGQWKAAS